MTNDERMNNVEAPKEVRDLAARPVHSGFGFPSSFAIRNSSFPSSAVAEDMIFKPAADRYPVRVYGDVDCSCFCLIKNFNAALAHLLVPSVRQPACVTGRGLTEHDHARRNS